MPKAEPPGTLATVCLLMNDPQFYFCRLNLGANAAKCLAYMMQHGQRNPPAPATAISDVMDLD